jgi:hypothetical protein
MKVNDENSRIRIQDPDVNPDPDPLVRGMDPLIRIHPKISWLWNTGFIVNSYIECYFIFLSSSFVIGVFVW